MDRFKLQMNWNQEELEQWALAAKQKEEDNLALQKYTRADESKIKELNLQIEKLTGLVNSKKGELDEEVTETQAKQIELDKTAEEFRSLHKERQSLVQQWQTSIEAMKKRDSEIAAAGERFAEAKALLEQKEEELAENASRLKMQEQDNSEQQGAVTLRERQLSKMREEAQMATQRLTQFADEVEVMKNELASAASELMKKRNENMLKNNEMEGKREALENARKRFQAVKKKLDADLANTDQVEASAKRAEDNLSDKEADLKRQEGLLSALKESMFKQSQELFALRQEEANLIAEISGAQAAGKNLSIKIHQLDQDSLRQQELIYNAEFQIQQLERKVARATGVRTGDEKKQLNDKIAELQSELEQLVAQRSMLQTQSRKLGDELRSQQRKCAECEAERKKQVEKIAELDLENTSAGLSLKQATKEKEEVMVQHDVMRLEVRRLRDALNARADEVFSLENRQFQLQMSMEERKKEIAVHREVQRAQVRSAEDERHRVTVELAERTTRVEKLRAKFETLMKLSGADDEGGEKSQAYFVIQAAQRREELQREGDELDSQIRKCEKEIRALENTLKHLTVRNVEYRSSFQRADPGSSEAAELRSLEEQAKSAQDILFKRKKEVQRMQTDFEEDSRRLAQVQDQSARLREHNEHLQSAHAQVQGELDAQRAKLERVAGKVQAASVEHRAAKAAGAGGGGGADGQTIEETVFRYGRPRRQPHALRRSTCVQHHARSLARGRGCIAPH
jgi:chromosome segregation ATPase